MSTKQRMRQALSRRLPVTEINVIAALLDPSQRNLTIVQDFLVDQETTAFHLLSLAMDKYNGGLQASNNASVMNEAASSSESAHAVSSSTEKGQTRTAVKTCPFYRYR